MKKRLVVITDCIDIAYSEIRGTILSVLKENSDEVVIEPVVPVHPFSIVNGAFVLRLMCECYPEGTVFSVVLNPLRERKERIVVFTKKKKYTIFTTNTGILKLIDKDFGIEKAYEVKDPGFLPFGGKYIHAPAVARYLYGIQLNDIANIFPLNKIEKIDIENGTVLHIDNFGLIKIFYDPNLLQEGKKYKVSFSNQSLDMEFVPRLMSMPDGKWALYPGSSLGFLEMGMARKNGTREINLEVGDKITITEK